MAEQEGIVIKEEEEIAVYDPNTHKEEFVDDLGGGLGVTGDYAGKIEQRDDIQVNSIRISIASIHILYPENI